MNSVGKNLLNKTNSRKGLGKAGNSNYSRAYASRYLSNEDAYSRTLFINGLDLVIFTTFQLFRPVAALRGQITIFIKIC